MLKKNLKLLVAIFIIIATLFSYSVCFADNAGDHAKAVTTSETAETTESAGEEEEQEIYNGDLYLIDNNIVMDKLVDGNVFIIGQNVEITGQINGNLFVLADTLKFNECYVRYSVFACANSIYYNGACNDLYVSANNLELTYDSYVVRDVKAVSKDVIFKAAIGRDLDLTCDNVNFGENEDTSVIYGKLRYSANSEAVIPEGVVTSPDSVTYTKPTLSSSNETVSDIMDILLNFLISIITVVAIYLLSKLFAPNFSEKLCNKDFSMVNIVKALGIGFVAFAAVIVASLILLLTQIGIKLAFILIVLFALLCLFAIPALTIKIANILKPVLKIEKTSIFYLILALVSVVLCGLTLIPFAGSLISFILKLVGIGILLDLVIPHKKLSEEEKLAIKEAKEKAKADKEAKKQEKLEAKEAKKKEKEDK